MECVAHQSGELSGRELALDEKGYQSATSSADKVNLKARELSQEGRLVDTPESTADLYLRQGSVSLTTRELAIMAATLANNGVNPVNQKRVVSEPVAKNIQTLLINAGWPGGKKADWTQEGRSGRSTGLRVGAMSWCPAGWALRCTRRRWIRRATVFARSARFVTSCRFYSSDRIRRRRELSQQSP